MVTKKAQGLIEQPATKPIEVTTNQGTKDSFAATSRYLIVILTALPTLMALVSERDLIGIIDYMKGNTGSALIAAAVALGTMGYGIFRTKLRGAQVATVAADKRVPDSLAKIV